MTESQNKQQNPYRHPLWQKKKYEIMDRAGWQCQECGSFDMTLQAHHRYYQSGV